MRSELCWTLLMLAVRGIAEPVPPQNLTMVTLNTNYELHWDWDQMPTDHVTFTVECLPSFKLAYKEERKDWTSPSSCQNTSSRFCDLTRLNLLYWGSYSIRVRASVKDVPSAWSSLNFCPDTDARLGPPSAVELSALGSDLEVVIQEPLTSNNTSMKEKLSSLTYHILYREHKGDGQSSRSVRSVATRVVLSDLQPQTLYCVAVQSLAESYVNKSSPFTTPQCTSTGGAPPWWLIFLYFIFGLMVCFLLVLPVLFIFVCYRTIKSTWCPSVPLPDPLRQLLSDSRGADRPHLLPPGVNSGLLCDQVSVCSELIIQDLPEPAAEMEIAPPSGVERDSRYHQGSQGSGDSGVYTSEDGVSSQQLPEYSGSSAASQDTWLDQVKLKSMMATSRTLPVVEGVVDVRV